MAEEQSPEQQRPPAVAPPEVMKFPREKDRYVLLAATGTGDACAMHAAKHVDPATGDEVPVAIKIVNMYKFEDIYTLTKEVHLAEKCDHENVVKVHCSFMVGNSLWIVIPLPQSSLRYIIRSSFRKGLPVNAVVFILREILKALDYLHGENKLHETMDAGCIFLEKKSGAVKLAFDSLTVCSNAEYRFPGWTITPELMMDYKKGNTRATDIWMFGLLALELFYGQIPASNIQEFQAFLTGIEKKKNRRQGSWFTEKIRTSFSCFNHKKKKIPGDLREVLAACLSRNPEKRPTANQLLEYNLFKTSSSGKESLAKLNI